MNSNILKSALISEKSFTAAGKSQFTFIVDKSASKDSVRQIVTELFDVEVIAVNMVCMKGKVKRTRKGTGKRSDFKKAILTLKKGQKIDLFEVEKDNTKGKGQEKVDNKRNRDIRQEKVADTNVVVREKKNTPRKVI
ncbi:MAG: 50S ribosomal protein L23 [bacterium]|nr:50S ribosomal protein L23 [bacterium]